MEFNKQNCLENIKYLKLLATQYPTIQSASSEIINLQATLDLPKGTEHFMSDLHGEYEAFSHIMNNASGAIREKVDLLFSNVLTQPERAVLSTIIYYPKQKLHELKQEITDLDEWYKITLLRLIGVCRLVASKYTRSRVREALPKDFGFIIEELLNTSSEIKNKEQYYHKIISTIIDIHRADAFIIALSDTIKHLVVDRLHIVGDIFDRGPGPDVIMDALMKHHSVDIQWGNHDILWMGAASGSEACIAQVINNCMQYSNLDVVEIGYGINLRPLAVFAKDTYNYSKRFEPKLSENSIMNSDDINLVSKIHKAIAIIQFKLEGQIILRRPEFNMNSRLLLDKINYEKSTITIDNKEYPLNECDFPTIDRKNPYKLSDEEEAVVNKLKISFLRSEKLQKHIRFLFSNGGIYTCYNSNLLFHGCIPMNDDGSFYEFTLNGNTLKCRELMDYSEVLCRQGFNSVPDSEEKQYGLDYMWFLWCGKNSPLFGRSKMATFERLFIDDQSTWVEDKNAYYTLNRQETYCQKILAEFGLDTEKSHIINGHIPVKSIKGESPVKSNGKLIVIDGGFCKAYHTQTGIAGYTLIYSSHGIRISAHEPFDSISNAIKYNKDILSTTTVAETTLNRITISETDLGKEIKNKTDDLKLLLYAFRGGFIKEQGTTEN